MLSTVNTCTNIRVSKALFLFTMHITEIYIYIQYTIQNLNASKKVLRTKCGWWAFPMLEQKQF
jgi:hypothetical protein